jgi:hypothetical protein
MVRAVLTSWLKERFYSKNNENVTCLRFLRKKFVTYENLRKLTKTYENLRKLTKTYENLRKLKRIKILIF